MASACIAAATLTNLLLLLQPWTATSNILAPIFSPLLDDVCKGVECGKGNCTPSTNSTLNFVCECQPGWKQTRSDKDNDFKFLPCVIPNLFASSKLHLPEWLPEFITFFLRSDEEINMPLRDRLLSVPS